jgi:hypothetical protein
LRKAENGKGDAVRNAATLKLSKPWNVETLRAKEKATLISERGLY